MRSNFVTDIRTPVTSEQAYSETTSPASRRGSGRGNDKHDAVVVVVPADTVEATAAVVDDVKDIMVIMAWSMERSACLGSACSGHGMIHDRNAVEQLLVLLLLLVQLLVLSLVLVRAASTSS